MIRGRLIIILVLLENGASGFSGSLIDVLNISLPFLISSYLRGLFLFLLIVKILYLLRCISIDVEGKAPNQLGSLDMLAIDYDRAVLSNLALLGVGLLAFATFLKLDLFHGARDDLFNKLMGFSVPHLIVVGLPFVWKNDVALLWASSVLDGITAGDTFPILNHMMLGSRILHMNEPTCGRNLLCVEKFRLGLIVVFLLESVEKVMCGVLGSLNLLHLLPNVFNIQIHNFVLVLHIEPRACIALLLHVSRWESVSAFLRATTSDGIFFLLNVHQV